MWLRMSVDLSMERAALDIEGLASACHGREQAGIPHLFEHVGLRFAGRFVWVRTDLVILGQD